MDYVSEVLAGPGTFRFVIQPVIAVLLGARDGRNDAKSGTPPYLHRLLFKSGDRTDSLKVGLRAIALPLIIRSLPIRSTPVSKNSICARSASLTW